MCGLWSRSLCVWYVEKICVVCSKGVSGEDECIVEFMCSVLYIKDVYRV